MGSFIAGILAVVMVLAFREHGVEVGFWSGVLIGAVAGVIVAVVEVFLTDG